MVQAHCDCPLDVAVERYRERVASPDRHPGHLPEHQGEAAIASWADANPEPLDLPGTLIHVPTTFPVDVPQVAARVAAALSTE